MPYGTNPYRRTSLAWRPTIHDYRETLAAISDMARSDIPAGEAISGLRTLIDSALIERHVLPPDAGGDPLADIPARLRGSPYEWDGVSMITLRQECRV